MFQCTDTICLLGRKQSRAVHSHRHTDADSRARCHVNLHVSFWDAGEGKMQMLSSSSLWHDVLREMSVCVSMWRKWRKEGFKGGDGTDSLIPRAPVCFSSSFFVREHSCYAATVDGRVSGECGNNSLFSFLIPPCFPSILSSVFHDWRMLCSIFFPLFFFLPSSSLSPMSLLLPSQVACRVRAGFAEAHACWQHTVTDLIAERKEQTEPQCKNPFPETARLQFGFQIFPKTFILQRIYDFDIIIRSLHLDGPIRFKRWIYFKFRALFCMRTKSIVFHTSKAHCYLFSLSSLVPFHIGERRKSNPQYFFHLFCFEPWAKADKSQGIQAKSIKNICEPGDGSIKWWTVSRHISPLLRLFIHYLCWSTQLRSTSPFFCISYLAYVKADLSSCTIPLLFKCVLTVTSCTLRLQKDDETNFCLLVSSFFFETLLNSACLHKMFFFSGLTHFPYMGLVSNSNSNLYGHINLLRNIGNLVFSSIRGVNEFYLLFLWTFGVILKQIWLWFGPALCFLHVKASLNKFCTLLALHVLLA